MVQKEPNITEALRTNATEIIHTLSFTVFHFVELYFIITGPQMIQKEVRINFLWCGFWMIFF